MADNPKVFMDITIDNAKAGRIVMELRADVVPKTAENFRALGLSRMPIVLGGDIGEGMGPCGKSIYGSTFEDENFQLKHDGYGILSMENRGRDTNGSQFFLCTAPTESMDGKHVVFGNVVEGLDIVKKMEEQGTQSGQPKSKVVIDNCGELKYAGFNIICQIDVTTEFFTQKFGHMMEVPTVGVFLYLAGEVARLARYIERESESIVMLAATETSRTLLLKGKQETRQNLVKELTNINADLSTKGITIHIPVLFKFDTRGFEPENIMLKTLNGQLVVQAKRQENDGEYHCVRQLDMTVRIPAGVNVEELKGYISSDGFLHMESLYTAPAIEQKKEEFREIPITHE